KLEGTNIAAVVARGARSCAGVLASVAGALSAPCGMGRRGGVRTLFAGCEDCSHCANFVRSCVKIGEGGRDSGTLTRPTWVAHCKVLLLCGRPMCHWPHASHSYG